MLTLGVLGNWTWRMALFILFFVISHFDRIRYFNGDHLFRQQEQNCSAWIKLLIVIFNWNRDEYRAITTSVQAVAVAYFIRSSDILHQHVHGKFGSQRRFYKEFNVALVRSRLTFTRWRRICIDDEIQTNNTIHSRSDQSERRKKKYPRHQSTALSTNGDRTTTTIHANWLQWWSKRCWRRITSQIVFFFYFLSYFSVAVTLNRFECRRSSSLLVASNRLHFLSLCRSQIPLESSN